MTAQKGKRARAPQQRQIKKTKQILDCVEKLIQEKDIEDISLAEVSQLTGIALPSVYYHFPNKNTILIALTQRIHENWRKSIKLYTSSDLKSWQDLISKIVFSGAEYLNKNPFVPKLILSSSAPVESKAADASQNYTLAKAIIEKLEEGFKGINKDYYIKYMLIAIYILDGIWQNSYHQHSYLPEHVIKEAQRAVISYLRCYFPEYLEKK